MYDEDRNKKRQHKEDDDDNSCKILKKEKDKESNYIYDDSEDKDSFCIELGNSPCDLIDMKELLSEEAERIKSAKYYRNDQNNLKSKRMYKFYAENLYRKLIEHVIVPISPYIMDFIRSFFQIMMDSTWVSKKSKYYHIN